MIPWLEKALSYLGISEIPGDRNNSTIVDFWKDIKQSGIKDDETSWCAAFVGAILEQVGIQSTRSGSARSYHNDSWGQTLRAPCVGCIVVFWRDDPKSIYGHVGFVVGRDQQNNLMVLGGNQGDKVCIKPFSSGRVLSYHWPQGFDIPKENGILNLPVVKSDGKLSTNES